MTIESRSTALLERQIARKESLIDYCLATAQKSTNDLIFRSAVAIATKHTAEVRNMKQVIEQRKG